MDLGCQPNSGLRDHQRSPLVDRANQNVTYRTSLTAGLPPGLRHVITDPGNRYAGAYG